MSNGQKEQESGRYHDMTFYGDEQPLNFTPPQKKLSEEIKIMILKGSFNEKQTKKLNEFYNELKQENL